MYADRKGWALEEVKTDIIFERNKEQNTSHIRRQIELIGNLEDTQKARLLSIANQCFIHKILTNPIVIDTDLI